MKLGLVLIPLLFSQVSFAAVTVCKGKDKNTSLMVVSFEDKKTNVMMLSIDGKPLPKALNATTIEEHDQKKITGGEKIDGKEISVSLSATADLSEGVVAYTENGKALLDKVTCKTE